MSMSLEGATMPVNSPAIANSTAIAGRGEGGGRDRADAQGRHDQTRRGERVVATLDPIRDSSRRRAPPTGLAKR